MSLICRNLVLVSHRLALNFSTSSKPPKKEIPFDTLLRQSSFMSLGDFEGRIIAGTIYHTIEDDLYIDFGGKFPCIVKRPSNGIQFVKGAKVKLRLNDWELSARFLGSSKDLTLLEADCTLLGLISSPVEVAKKLPASPSQSSGSTSQSSNQ
ncbi:28S ribosomal protein S28, mitochondrial [Tetranychus urticae]|uniref:28S ribosomal protein S28, mitochondrial n=1 Tax=Tetranychus urticae TaxID=32264 RepID=UPI00077BC3C6|nr:28S ribosomal protein S28, mitochondrial [Tetranychus urticae]